MIQDTIHSLWIGRRLSRLELLSLHSFLRAGHEFHLWVYEALETEVPAGIVLRDAKEIIPQEEVFAYRYASSMGHGLGSYAGFSDLFRYKLLYEHGGWWVDMDITCLKPFDFPAPYFFRKHHVLPLVGNVMKCPQGSELMLLCYEEAKQVINADNRDWHAPIEILVNGVMGLDLAQYIHSGLSNEDKWHEDTVRWVSGPASIPEEYYFLHWQNEAWRHFGLDKDHVKYTSTLARLMQEHSLLPAAFSQKELRRNRLYHSRFAANLRLLGVLEP